MYAAAFCCLSLWPVFAIVFVAVSLTGGFVGLVIDWRERRLIWTLSILAILSGSVVALIGYLLARFFHMV